MRSKGLSRDPFVGFATSRRRQRVPRCSGMNGTRDRADTLLGLTTRSAQAAGAGPLSLPQRLLLVSRQRREKVADDPARARLDLDRHRHAGTELDELILHLHVRAVE